MNLARLRFIFRYLRRPSWDSGIVPPELVDYIETHPPGRAIDLGCGTGTNVTALVQSGWKVTGVDFVPRAISLAKYKLKEAKLTADLRVGDVTDLHDLDGPFDFALDIGCFHGVEDKPAYLIELKRLLVAGGHWLMYGFFTASTARSGPGLAEADLELILARGFSLLSRTDGFDKRERRSAWFLFERQKR